jgi:hypothetical protein
MSEKLETSASDVRTSGKKQVRDSCPICLCEQCRVQSTAIQTSKEQKWPSEGHRKSK